MFMYDITSILGIIYTCAFAVLALGLLIALIVFAAKKKARTKGSTVFFVFDLLLFIIGLALVFFVVISNVELFGLSLSQSADTLNFDIGSLIISIPFVGELAAIWQTYAGMGLVGLVVLLSFIDLILSRVRRPKKAKASAVEDAVVIAEEETVIVIEDDLDEETPEEIIEEAVEESAEDADEIYEEIIEESVETVEDVAAPAEEVIEVPIEETVEDVVEPAEETVSEKEVVEILVETVEEPAEEVIEPIEEVIPTEEVAEKPVEETEAPENQSDAAQPVKKEKRAPAKKSPKAVQSTNPVEKDKKDSYAASVFKDYLNTKNKKERSKVSGALSVVKKKNAAGTAKVKTNDKKNSKE